MSLWDSVVASASKAVTQAVTQAGEATQAAATKAKLHADILVIDRDIHARKEKFGIDMYAHLEKITSTQEFYVADDKLINIIRPTLIKAQREVAAYEKKRDAMKGKVNLAEANRSSTGSIIAAETMGQKLFNAASFIQAGAKEAACKTELAMLERQIRGFKEEFGVELYPIFQSMEDNEGWLPTDRKVRSLYDQAREDIAAMEKAKEEKREQIKNLDGVEGNGLTPPTVPAPQLSSTTTVVATPVPSNNYQVGGQTPWASSAPDTMNTFGSAAYGTSYGSSQPTSNICGMAPPAQTTFGSIDQKSIEMQVQIPKNQPSSFGFIQNPPVGGNATNMSLNGTNTTSFLQPTQTFGASNTALNASIFDPFDGLSSATCQTSTASNFNATSAPQNEFDPFSNSNRNASGTTLSEADMSLFKY
ncbi:hypothetical protein ACHAWX_003576 [Stephanocyclus meneghinianus]